MKRSDLIDYYSLRASEYERIYLKPERQEDLRALRTLVQSLTAGHDVLEIACGTGYWTKALAASARSVVATDVSTEVLEIARRKSYPEGRVRFESADAFELGAVPGRFTTGFAGFWWSHLRKDEIARFLRALHGRLDPEARVLFIDNRYVEGSSTPIARRDGTGNTYQIRRLENGSEHEVLKNFPTEVELRTAVDGIGADVAVVELTYYWVFTYILEALHS